MLSSHFMNAGLLVFIAFIFQAAGFLARDEFILRMLVLVGNLLYVAYYFLYPAQPLWDAIAASLVLAFINLALIAVIIRERTLVAMSEPETLLFNHFEKFTPGQFRRLMKAAKWHQRMPETILTELGEVPSRLYYVTDGRLRIDKGETSASREGNTFIGEIGFLYNSPASATVTAEEATTWIAWDSADLKALLKRHPAMENAMIATLSFDLARKVASSTPIARTVPAN
jgi:hypothetical protein